MVYLEFPASCGFLTQGADKLLTASALVKSMSTCTQQIAKLTLVATQRVAASAISSNIDFFPENDWFHFAT
jgi:hypothetical protein